jgi:hypothetical protein
MGCARTISSQPRPCNGTRLVIGNSTTRCVQEKWLNGRIVVIGTMLSSIHSSEANNVTTSLGEACSQLFHQLMDLTTRFSVELFLRGNLYSRQGMW